MDILKDKTSISYEYISRYANFYFYYNTEDKKYIYGLTQQLSNETSYVTVKIEPGMTLDSLADKYYGRPDYFWIIADFNRLSDPFITLYPEYESIKIPSMGSIEYEESIRFNK